MAEELRKKFKYEGITTLEVLEGADRYNQWIAESISKYLESPLLEIGAGIGNISMFLLNNNSLTITDIDQALLDHLKKKFRQKNVKVKFFDITKPPSKSEFNKYKTILGTNVLEHVDNDIFALKNLRKILKKEGRLILLTPAKKIAYNRLDIELGHFRRYEKKELIEKLNGAGYDVLEIKFFNILGLLTWIVRDYFTGQNIHLTSRQIALFDALVPFLKRIEKLIKIPIGISLIVVAQPRK